MCDTTRNNESELLFFFLWTCCTSECLSLCQTKRFDEGLPFSRLFRIIFSSKTFFGTLKIWVTLSFNLAHKFFKGTKTLGPIPFETQRLKKEKTKRVVINPGEKLERHRSLR